MGAAAADAWPTATTKAASAIAAIVAPTLNRFTDDVMENYFHLDEKDRRCALSRASNPVLSKRRAGIPAMKCGLKARGGTGRTKRATTVVLPTFNVLELRTLHKTVCAVR